MVYSTVMCLKTILKKTRRTFIANYEQFPYNDHGKRMFSPRARSVPPQVSSLKEEVKDSANQS